MSPMGILTQEYSATQISGHTCEAMEMTYAPSESLPNSAATRNVSSTSLTSGATYKAHLKILKQKATKIKIEGEKKT